MADFKPTPRKKNALDHRKLNLTAPCPTAQGKYSALIWGVYSNNPRLTVYTGDPEDASERTGYGRIAANLDTPTFFAFVNMLERMAKSDKEDKDCIKNKNYTWFGGKRSETPALVSTLWVGKDKEGHVWISVVAENRPVIKFIIGPSEFHSLFHGDGKPFTTGEASTLYGIGYCDILRNMVSNVLVSEYVEDVPKNPQQNNRGGQQGGYNNNNRGGQQQGGYNNNNNRGNNDQPSARPPAQADDGFQANDIPF